MHYTILSTCVYVQNSLLQKGKKNIYIYTYIVLGVLKTILKFDDLLGGLTGLSTESYSEL